MKKNLIYTGSVDDAFIRIRSRANNLIANLLPNAWEKLNSAFDLLDSEQTEMWSNAVHSCRRILEDVSDFVYPPTKDRLFNEHGKPTKLGKDQYINRIMAFLHDSQTSETFAQLVGENINLFWKRLNSIYQASNKGSHEVISNQEEADRYVVNTYLIVSDILSLWYSKTKPANLIEGLSNTIFYIPYNEALMNLYYFSKISPYKLIIKPNYPLGTGIRFIVTFKKNNVELEQAFSLNILFNSKENLIPDDFEVGQYIQIGTHEFQKNKNPFLLIAIGDGIINLKVLILEYIPAKSLEDIDENSWEIIGNFDGQAHCHVDNTEIYFPYGTQGLGTIHKWSGNTFLDISNEI